MEDVALQQLNDRFGTGSEVTFVRGEGDLPQVKITNQHAEALIAIQGGQALRYQARGHDPILWVSDRSIYRVGTAVRGGIPLCWPWFGPHPEDASLPQHGFVRKMMWSVEGTARKEDGSSEVRLGLRDDDQSRGQWPHPFRLELVVVVGPRLHVDLHVHNPGDQPFTCGGALHTYFDIGAVEDVEVGGLEGRDYIDKVNGGSRKHQDGPVRIQGETDRIYLQTAATCTIRDARRRRIHIEKRGSNSTVIWNPWQEKARQIPDFAPEEYRRMLCVETTNAADDQIEVMAGGMHILGTTIWSEGEHA